MEIETSIPCNKEISEITLCYKSKLRAEEAPTVNSSYSAYKQLLKYWNMDTIELREEFKIILLNTKLKAIGLIDISVGGLDAAFVDIRIIFAAALKCRATSIILAHNHPSLDTKPSAADLKLTNDIVNAGKLLRITVFDHLIITPKTYYSMADNGVLHF